MKKLIQHSFMLGGMLILNQPLEAAFKASNVSSMAKDTVAFVNALNSSVQQAGYLASASPRAQSGMRGLQNYYRNRHTHFVNVLNANIELMEKAHQVTSEVTRMGGPYAAVSTCIAEDRDWKRFRSSFESLGLLREFAETGINSGFPSAQAAALEDRVRTDLPRIGAGLELRDTEGSFWTPIDKCCAKAKVSRSGDNMCNEDYMRSKLAFLSDIQRLPAQFVDPVNPGQFAPSLSPQDIVELMSLGQMQDFIAANDFNSQAMALANADAKCTGAREDAILALNKKGELRSVIQTGAQALQCSMGTLARNWGRTGRQVALAVVKGQFPLFTSVLSCPQEVQDSAAKQLRYSPEAFRADFQHLVTLPGNIIQSRPVAKPVEISNNNGTLMIELRDEAGYTVDTLLISDEVNPQYAQMQVAGTQVGGGTGLQVVSTGTAGPNNNIRTTGRSMVNGVGTTRGQGERVLVRGLASKAAEGDLESARTLAGSVKNRTTELKRNVVKASNEKSLIRGNKLERAAEARGLVTRATMLEGVVETSKSFRKNFTNLHRALGLTDPNSDSGRVVERPGSGGNTNTAGSGSTVTSNLPSYADQAASAAYKQEQARKGIAKIKDTITNMAENIVAISAKLNQIIKQKEELEIKLPLMANEGTRLKIDDAGFDNRGRSISNEQQPIIRVRQEINTLNAQEIGLRAAIATAKNSFNSFVNGAAAFQGLMVTRSASRAPASTDPMFANNAGAQQNPFQIPQLNNIQGTSNLPPGMTPPAFTPSPTLTQPGAAGVFKFLDMFALPMAHAQALSPAQKRERLMKEFEAFIESYSDYADRLEQEVVGVRQQAWERFILNERQMREEPLLSSEERVIMFSFADAVSEEVPDLIKIKNSGKLSSGTDRQLLQYIEQIRADSAELNELLMKESAINAEVQSKSAVHDDISWTGMLPAIALQ